MKNTGTVILWPSRLKIGAKSKKGEDGGREGRERGGRVIYFKIKDYQNCLYQTHRLKLPDPLTGSVKLKTLYWRNWTLRITVSL